ncbi:MAG TPA: DUF2442 domain-containing protein [Treponema sp.]|nr:DUF2442 domain-containing protein [Treponema sp.]
MTRVSSPSPVFVKALENYRLFLRFDNQEERIFDVTPYLKDTFFASLANPVIFNTVKTNGLTVEWMGNIDICPDELYENSKPL